MTKTKTGRKPKIPRLPQTLEELHPLVRRAARRGACQEELVHLWVPESLEAAYAHKHLAYWLYWYSRYIIKGRWPEAEEYINKDALVACWYANDVIKDRWPEAEEVIKTGPWGAYQYAYNVIHGRWPEAEGYIKTSPEWAYWYSRNVIRGRWPEAEATIRSDPIIAKRYNCAICKG